MWNFVTPKSHGIPRNSAEFYEFRNTEFRVIPRNLGQFRILYGIYGIKKNIRNSVCSEFRKHPMPECHIPNHGRKTTGPDGGRWKLLARGSLRLLLSEE